MGITCYAIELKICTITAGVKTCKSIMTKKEAWQNSIIRKNKLNNIED